MNRRLETVEEQGASTPRSGIWQSLIRTAKGLAVCTALISPAACASAEPEAPAGDPLREVSIPEDFTFAMSRALHVDVLADANLAPYAPLSITVSLPTGEALFRGAIEPGATRSIEVLSPLATGDLQVKLTGRSKVIETTVEVTGPRLQVELR
jgi:hypothetical protein